MFGSFGAGFDDPTDSEFADLFGGYIEENTNVPSRPLDLGDDGINIRTEADALDSGTAELDEVLDEIQALQADANQPVADMTYEEILRIDPDVGMSGINLEKLNEQVPAARPLKDRGGKMPGKSNPKADWRVKDTSNKWWKPRQKFEMGDVDEQTEALAAQEEAAVPTEEPDPFGIGVVDDEAEALAREEEKASEVLQLSNDEFEQRLDDAIDAFHENPKIRPAEEFLDVQPTAEQMKMLEMNALTLAASEDSMSATALLGETMEEGSRSWRTSRGGTNGPRAT